MTNASMKNTFVALSVTVVMAAALSLGAFASTAHAADEWGFGDLGGGFDYGYIDSYPSDYGYIDSYPSDYGYVDSYPYDYGYVDSYPYDYGYVDSYPYDYGYVDSYPYDYCNCDTPSYSYDTYDMYDTYSYSQPYNFGSGFSMPISYSTPTFSAPNYPSSRPVIQPVQQQQQQQQQATVSPINIVNNNNNTNNNNNVNTVTVPVSVATAQPIVQYVQQPIYYPQPQPVYPQPQPTYQAPYCVVTAVVGSNGYVTLYWSSSYATSAYITPNVGTVAPNGSTSLYGNYGTQYTMTVYGQGGSSTCRTQMTYAPTTSVSLTQIPYTGFDLGPIGNAIYWAALMVFALAGAYLAIYYKGGALALVSSGIGRSKAQAPLSVSAPAAQSTVVAAPAAAKADVFASLPTMKSTSTKDSMQLVKGADGSARIVINRN